MNQKPDTRIGATKESLSKLMASLEKAKAEARLAPPGEEYTKIAEYFVMPMMLADAKAVLDLPEEARDAIFRKIGEGFCKSFAKTSALKWDLDWLTEVAKAAMAGMIRGIFELDEENKNKVLDEQARACFLKQLKRIKAWEKHGITIEPGSYTPDGAVAFLGNMLALRDVTKHKDTIFWIGNTRAAYERCCCSIYRSGIINEQLPEYCQCAVKLMRYQFEYLTGEPMESEVVETLNCGGADVCSFRVHVKPTRITSR